MATTRSKKALLEVIPPRICVTFCRGSLWYRPENSKILVSDDRSQNTTNTGPGSLDNFSENVENHENGSGLDSYSTNRAENQGFWIYKVLQIQWDPSRPPKLPYKFQNRSKIQWTPPEKVYTKLFRRTVPRGNPSSRRPGFQEIQAPGSLDFTKSRPPGAWIRKSTLPDV